MSLERFRFTPERPTERVWECFCGMWLSREKQPRCPVHLELMEQR